MKNRLVCLLLALALCLLLCACGGGKDGDSIALPTKPVQIQVATENKEAVSSDVAENGTDAEESTEGKYPWEIEFREEDYQRFEITAPEGDKIVTWREGTIFGHEARELYEWPDGQISDSYYYPSGNLSHVYTWYPDGSYYEAYYLDDGYYDSANQETVFGTQIHYKSIQPDGSWFEGFRDENGMVTGRISVDAAGAYSEEEFFEDGNLKRSKYQTQEYTVEEHYDEEAYSVYYYYKDASFEIELTADETGKLVKIVENGEVKEDEATLTQYAKDYNFRQ